MTRRDHHGHQELAAVRCLDERGRLLFGALARVIVCCQCGRVELDERVKLSSDPDLNRRIEAIEVHTSAGVERWEPVQ